MSENASLGPNAQIRNEVIRRLYEAYFPGQEPVMVRPILQEQGWDERFFWQTLDEMSIEGIIKCYSSGPQYIITPIGILHSEQRNLCPGDLAARNKRVRTRVLEKYADAYEEKGHHHGSHFHEIVRDVAAETEVDEALVGANHQFLFEAGQLEHPGTLGFFMIAQVGLTAVREWRRRTSLLKDFEKLQESVKPQERGRDFQGLFGELARGVGWSVEESVLGSGEEIDLVLHRENIFYLIECRWKTDPVSTKEIRDFAGKLRKRSAVQGIFVSMSGYTGEAVKEVEGTTGDTPMVLVGPEEICALFDEGLDFNELLAQKKRALVMHRKAAWR